MLFGEHFCLLKMKTDFCPAKTLLSGGGQQQQPTSSIAKKKKGGQIIIVSLPEAIIADEVPVGTTS
jgi:hypothetical protein